jgi:transaldolase
VRGSGHHADFAVCGPHSRLVQEGHGQATTRRRKIPACISVQTIYNYYKKFGYKTEVMGASFRNIGEITELAGCDLLTISPALLADLNKTEGDLPRKLDPELAKTLDIKRIPMDKRDLRQNARRRPHGARQAEGRHRRILESASQSGNILAQRITEMEEQPEPAMA